jgi:hypothetical protein
VGLFVSFCAKETELRQDSQIRIVVLMVFTEIS